MTNDEINEVIAETLGKVDRLSDEEFTTAMKEWEDEPEHPHASLTRPVKVRLLTTADFANDLNAMHEAESALSPLDHQKFCLFLHKQIMGTMDNFDINGTCNLECISRLVRATAHQRAEAFIRIVCPEKWKGNE